MKLEAIQRFDFDGTVNDVAGGVNDGVDHFDIVQAGHYLLGGQVAFVKQDIGAFRNHLWGNAEVRLSRRTR